MLRMTERITEEREARLVRARAEGADYVWTKSPLGWIVTTGTGKVYQVDARSCSCQDFVRRCAGTALVCKHVTAFRLKMIAEQERQAPPVIADEAAARRAAVAQRVFDEA
jgi:predicted nucleic acid-binding Zn finger protein